MPLVFDATLKDLAEAGPADFLAAVAGPCALPVQLLNVDLSVITTSTDLVFGVGDPREEVVHVECQASAKEKLGRQVLVRNALLHDKYEVPVHSIVLLLRPEAQHGHLTGAIRYASRTTRSRMGFEYEVVRLWEQPPEPFLHGPPTVPLAPLCRLPEGVSLEDGMSALIRRAVERILTDVAPDRIRKFLTATYVLSGLRIGRHLVQRAFEEAGAMEESDTYMELIERGQLKEAKRIVLRAGQKRFGPPPEGARAAVEGTTDIEWLERLNDRILDVSSWRELLESP